jgi:hypothetical protein
MQTQLVGRDPTNQPTNQSIHLVLAKTYSSPRAPLRETDRLISLSIVYTVLWMRGHSSPVSCDVVLDYICLLMSVREEQQQQQELEISLMLGVSCLTLRS